jgi:rhomboid protease GluP
VYDHHYFRLLASLVLFRNLYHLSTNLLCIMILGSYVEHLIGWKKMFLLVVLSGVGGELFGTIFNQKVSIEGSTPVCGLIGYLIGIALLLWRKWERYSN